MIYHCLLKINNYRTFFLITDYFVIFIIMLYYGKWLIYGKSSGLPDTFFICYFTGESNRSVMLQLSPCASCSSVLILGFDSSPIFSYMVDFGTPDMIDSCLTDRFLSYMIWDNNIFILLLFPNFKKI